MKDNKYGGKINKKMERDDYWERTRQKEKKNEEMRESRCMELYSYNSNYNKKNV